MSACQVPLCPYTEACRCYRAEGCIYPNEREPDNLFLSVYALSVKKARTVIYPAHGLYQNINVVFAGQAVEVNALLFVVSVNNALVFLIYKYICSVGEAVKIELAAVFSDEMMMISR